MFLISISIILSLETKNHKTSHGNTLNKNYKLFTKDSKSNTKFLADSFGCYNVYLKAFNALNSIPPKQDRKILLKDEVSNALEALGTFKEICADTAAEDTCAALLSGITTDNPPVKENAATFKADCLIPEPNADTDDCYSAYDSLIKSIQNIETKRTTRKNLKGTPLEEFNNFITKCSSTVNGEKCSEILNAIDSTDGPNQNDLEDIQTNCVVAPPVSDPTEPQGDTGIISSSLNIKTMFFVLTLIPFYFMI
jgi:hypothetical protein